MIFGNHPQNSYPVERRLGSIVFAASGNFTAKAWPGDDAASDHDMLRAAYFPAVAIVIGRPDFTIGDNGNVKPFDNRAEILPMRRRPVSFELSARVNGEFSRPSFRDGKGIFHGQCLFGKTEPHLCADRHSLGHRLADSRDNHIEPVRPLQQGRPGVMPVHGFGGTAEIDIDPRRAKLGNEGRILGHDIYLAAHDLNMHGNPCRGFSALLQLRAVVVKDRCRKQILADAHEFADAEIKPANAGQNIAHIYIDDPFHRGQRHRRQSVYSSIFLVIF